MRYQAIIPAPFGMLGIRCAGDALLGIDFLPATESPHCAENPFAEKVGLELSHYFQDPFSEFSIRYRLSGTPHQLKVWRAILEISPGTTCSYGELASLLQSSAQAVGQACGANPLPIIVPCHRVVSKGALGGFMKHCYGAPLEIKRWLLKHEQR